LYKETTGYAGSFFFSWILPRVQGSATPQDFRAEKTYSWSLKYRRCAKSKLLLKLFGNHNGLMRFCQLAQISEQVYYKFLQYLLSLRTSFRKKTYSIKLNNERSSNYQDVGSDFHALIIYIEIKNLLVN